MLQAVNTDLFNPSVPKAHNSESQNLLFPLQIKPVKKSVKASWRIFISCNLGTIMVNPWRKAQLASRGGAARLMVAGNRYCFPESSWKSGIF